MPVVINEFEVLPAPPDSSAESAPTEQIRPEKPAAGDMERMCALNAERELRIRAY